MIPKVLVIINYFRCLGHTPAEDAAWHERRNDNNASTPNLQTIIDLLNNQKGLQKYKVKTVVFI